MFAEDVLNRPPGFEFEELQLPNTISTLSVIHLQIFSKRRNEQLSYQEIVEYFLMYKNVEISKQNVKTAIKWTALGYKWRPGMKGGTHPFLNNEDIRTLVKEMQVGELTPNDAMNLASIGWSKSPVASLKNFFIIKISLFCLNLSIPIPYIHLMFKYQIKRVKKIVAKN